jgi:hypothetical protein
VNPWIPYEVHSSPHDLQGYDEPLFPVAETPIGRIGCAIWERNLDRIDCAKRRFTAASV